MTIRDALLPLMSRGALTGLLTLGVLVALGSGCGPDDVPPSPPRMDVQPVSVSVEECQAAMFAVRASGSSPLRFQWFENGSPIQDATSGTLVLDRVGLSDSRSTFSVTVSNPAGTTTSEVATLLVSEATHEVVLTDEAALRLASDGTTLYWTDGIGVRASSVDCSGPIRSLYERQQLYENAIGLALAPGHLAWSDTVGGNVRTISTEGGSAVVVATGVPGLYELTAGAGQVFWPSFSGPQKVALGGGPVIQLASIATNASGITVDDRYVYWTDASAGTVNLVPIDGGDVVELASGQALPGAIASDGQYVYWTTTADRDTDHPSGHVMKVSRSGGPPVVLANQPLDIYPLVLHGSTVFWTAKLPGVAGAGAISRMPADGTAAPSAIASALDGPHHLTVDSRYVYWSDDRGIVRLNK